MPGEVHNSPCRVFAFTVNCAACALFQVTEHHGGCARLYVKSMSRRKVILSSCCRFVGARSTFSHGISLHYSWRGICVACCPSLFAAAHCGRILR